VCLLIAMFKVVPAEPLIMAANRDEHYDRPAVAITTLRSREPRVLGGRDDVAGGTWMAVNEHGLVAALTNLPSPGGRDVTKRSRGELPLALAGRPDAAAAVAWICACVDPSDYNPCWLMVGDRESLFYVDMTSGRRPAARQLKPGTYVLENAPLLPQSAKAAHVAGLIAAARAVPGADVRDALSTVLRDHSPVPASQPPGEDPDGAGPRAGGLNPAIGPGPASGRPPPAGPASGGPPAGPLRPAGLSAACVHAEGYGTRSAMIVSVGTSGPPRVLVADGPPCQAPLADVSDLWTAETDRIAGQQLAGG
jgi:uncharacterized protein with NRDE domain